VRTGSCRPLPRRALALLASLAALGTTTAARADNYLDADGSHLWSHAANWNVGHVPLAGEPVSFNGGNCTIDISTASLGAFNINSPSTVVLASGMTLTANSYSQLSGTFSTAGSTVINIATNLAIGSAQGGTFSQTATDVINIGRGAAGGGIIETASATSVSFGAVTFTGASAAISGNNTYAQLILTAAGNLSFAPGFTQVITGALTLRGASPSAPLTLACASPGSSWFIDARGSRELANVTVSDSTNNNATPITAVNSVDAGNNHGWLFVTASSAPALPAWGPWALAAGMLGLLGRVGRRRARAVARRETSAT
jgi:hypothetical protein